MRTRVVVTGLGTTNPLGNNVSESWTALLEGRSGIGRIAQFDPSELTVQIAAEVKGFDPGEVFGRRIERRNDRFTLFALHAAKEALQDAALLGDEQALEAGGVLVASAIGGVITLTENIQVLAERGERRVSPFMVPMMMPNAAAATISIEYGLRGPSLSLNSACATGANAIGEAAEMIRRGRAQMMVCGGSEAAIRPVSLAAFRNMGAITSRNEEPTRASRPFDAYRDGFVMGEGAAVLVLESMEYATRRGARIYCEMAGYGTTADAYHIAAPEEDGRGAVAAMVRALDDASVPPSAVDYVNAHGTSTKLNDEIETKAIREVFGPHADRLPVSSTKSMMGHLMGAAGAVEALACVKSIETGWVHPTVNYETPDPACDLDYVPNQARLVQPTICLSNSFGFGGHNACLVLRALEA